MTHALGLETPPQSSQELILGVSAAAERHHFCLKSPGLGSSAKAKLVALFVAVPQSSWMGRGSRRHLL